MLDPQDFHQRIGKIEGLVRELESISDPALRRIANDLVQSLMELHGAGIERLLEIVSTARSDTGAVMIESLANDPLVSSLLVLYDLHPDDFETRIRRGLDKVQPELQRRGARIELVSAMEGLIRLRIIGAGTQNLEPLVREALFETAPDAVKIEIDGLVPKNSAGFVPLTSLRALDGSPVAAGGGS